MFCRCIPIIEINECTTNAHNCDLQATCTNTQGSFECFCNQGFTGNGISCSGYNKFFKDDFLKYFFLTCLTLLTKCYNLKFLSKLLLYTQILTNALPGLTTVIPSWPLVIIHLGLFFATAFKVTQETGSCVQVKPKFVNCTCFKKRCTFLENSYVIRYLRFSSQMEQSACVRFQNICTGFFH